MAAHQARLDALANDVANVNTDGYKAQRIGFRELVSNQEGVVEVGAGSAAIDAGRSFRQGTLVETDDPLSLAIEGPGFFQVQRADGQLALTRDGRFRLDAKGALVTTGGERIVPPITVPAGATAGSVHIAADGTVTAGGTKIGQLAIVNVPAPAGLRSVGDSLYAATAQSGAPALARGSQVRSGRVEASNVEIGESMVDMMQAQRGFELQSRVIKIQDQLMEIANGIRR
jgi:flagellar basal-body rod protein FlgG